MTVYVDKKNKFIETFDNKTGFYMRSGIIDKNGRDTGVDPFMRDFPGLIDIGIMGSCIHGSSGLCIQSGVQCYQSGLKIKKPNITFENFKKIIDQCKGKVFQCALGGRGDVDQHENLEEILSYCCNNNIVPNFTTSGLGLTQEIVDICKDKVGAVAVSFYRAPHTYKAINLLTSNNIKTNIHYVLGNNSIDEAIERLTNNSFPDGINAIIFLMHKPIGLGKEENVLRPSDPRVKQFFEIIDSQQFDFKIGFDSCSCAGIVNFTNNINIDSIDYCEGARHSCYIDAQMNMMPCSFGNNDNKWFVNLNDCSIEEAWYSEAFYRFRHSLLYSCKDCKDGLRCGGGCPIVPQITLCNRKEKDFKEIKKENINYEA
jgi:radical SAM protein with 4Fe4S-binding SPASM domain